MTSLGGGVCDQYLYNITNLGVGDGYVTSICITKFGRGGWGL